MSKKKIVEIISDSGINYGQINHPNDLMQMQDYNRDHVENLTKDYMSGQNAEVAGCGFGYAGMTFSVAEGRIYKLGKQYDAAFTNVQLAAANGTHPRIDLIIATISEDVPNTATMVAFQRLRTSGEISAGTIYPPTQFSRSTQKENRAVISVKTGTPAASPTAPILAANEVQLCAVTVPAGGTSIAAGWLLDVRNAVTNLAALEDEVDTLQSQMIQALNYENQVRNFETTFGRSDTLNGILAEISQALLVLRYRYPTLSSGNGQLPAEIVGDGGFWVCDIPIGVFTQFGDRYVAIRPEAFVDPSLNARYATSGTASNSYAPIFDNQSEIEDFVADPGASPTANVVRFNVPIGTKALNVNRDGQITLTDLITPTNGTHCLIAKITSPDGIAKPTIKTYQNVRNGTVTYSKIYNAADPTTKQFEWAAGTPPGVGFIEQYAISNSDKHHYNFDDLSIPPTSFDGVITLNGIADGDRWIVRHWILSQI